jgi:hypothetical protein
MNLFHAINALVVALLIHGTVAADSDTSVCPPDFLSNPELVPAGGRGSPAPLLVGLFF